MNYIRLGCHSTTRKTPSSAGRFRLCATKGPDGFCDTSSVVAARKAASNSVNYEVCWRHDLGRGRKAGRRRTLQRPLDHSIAPVCCLHAQNGGGKFPNCNLDARHFLMPLVNLPVLSLEVNMAADSTVCAIIPRVYGRRRRLAIIPNLSRASSTMFSARTPERAARELKQLSQAVIPRAFSEAHGTAVDFNGLRRLAVTASGRCALPLLRGSGDPEKHPRDTPARVMFAGGSRVHSSGRARLTWKSVSGPSMQCFISGSNPGVERPWRFACPGSDGW